MKLRVEQAAFDLPFDVMGVLHVRQDGTCAFPQRMLGQISAFFAKKFIRETTTENVVEYQHGTIRVRVTRS